VPATVVRDRFHRTPIAAPGLSRTVYLAQRRGMAQPRAARALRDEIIRFLGETSTTGRLPPGVRTV